LDVISLPGGPVVGSQIPSQKLCRILCRIKQQGNMSDSDLLRKIDQDISTVSSRVDRICIVGGIIIGYWIVSWIVAFLDVWNSQ